MFGQKLKICYIIWPPKSALCSIVSLVWGRDGVRDNDDGAGRTAGEMARLMVVPSVLRQVDWQFWATWKFLTTSFFHPFCHLRGIWAAPTPQRGDAMTHNCWDVRDQLFSPQFLASGPNPWSQNLGLPGITISESSLNSGSRWFMLYCCIYLYI